MAPPLLDGLCSGYAAGACGKVPLHERTPLIVAVVPLNVTCPLIHRSARPRQRGGAVFAFTRLVHLVGALARPLPAGAGTVPGVALSLSATFAHERPARRCLMIATSVSCSPWCHCFPAPTAPRRRAR